MAKKDKQLCDWNKKDIIQKMGLRMSPVYQLYHPVNQFTS